MEVLNNLQENKWRRCSECRASVSPVILSSVNSLDLCFSENNRAIVWLQPYRMPLWQPPVFQMRRYCFFIHFVLPDMLKRRTAPWDTKNYKCTRGTGCELWDDDDMLLDADQRGQQIEEPIDIPELQPVTPEPAPPPYILRQYPQYTVTPQSDYSWIHDDGNFENAQLSIT